MGCTSSDEVRYSISMQSQSQNSINNTVLARGYRPVNYDSARSIDDDTVDEYAFTGLTYINLAAPIVNPFLAGRGYDVWRHALGVSKDRIKRIIEGMVCYNTVENREYDINELAKSSSILCSDSNFIYGAKYALYLLDKVDMQASFNKCLLETYILPLLSQEDKKSYLNGNISIGRVRRIAGFDSDGQVPASSVSDTWLFAEYEWDDSEAQISDESLYNINEHLIDSIVEESSNDQYDDVAIFYRGLDGSLKENLKKQVMDYMFLLPLGFRPTISGRNDKLSVVYNQLVYRNRVLSDATVWNTDTSLYNAMQYYKSLVDIITTLYIGNGTIERQLHIKDYKSLSGAIGGKTGLMRSKMQSTRIDYSGRTVISSNPTYKIDEIGVPFKIIRKIAETRVIDAIRRGELDDPDVSYSTDVKDNNLSNFASGKMKIKGRDYDYFVKKWVESADHYVIIGRQPTLFYLGMQAFKLRIAEGDTIVLSPLVVMPFNADFDGDQMHVNMPVTKAGIRDVEEHMSFKNNLFYPKNGELTVVVRLEIKFGLYMCGHVTTASTSTSESDPRKIYEGVCNQTIEVGSKCGSYTAGVQALAYAVGGGCACSDVQKIIDESGSKRKITDKDINNLLLRSHGNNKEEFLEGVNRLVKLGFRVSKIWAPNISVIHDQATNKTVDDEVKEFNEKIEEKRHLMKIGLEIQSKFEMDFNEEYSKLYSRVKDKLIEDLPSTNGYKEMFVSGSKGDESNIMQIYGFKGQIQRSDGSGFSTIVSGSYANQLTGLEHFMTAYGGRKGLADKVLATARHGYLSRKLEHAGSTVSISTYDCWNGAGERKTLDLYLKDIVPFIDKGSMSNKYPPTMCYTEAEYNTAEWNIQLNAAVDYLSKIIVGRNVIDDEGECVFINNIKEAVDFIKGQWSFRAGDIQDTVIDDIDEYYGQSYYTRPVKLRSPIYCDDPCCQTCYGRDISIVGANPVNIDENGQYPVLGRSVGFIAAQSIGEPGTQLTMKKFQKGGIISGEGFGKAASPFKVSEDYLELHDITKKTPMGTISYDPISPIDASIRTQGNGSGGKKIILVAKSPEDTKIARAWNARSIVIDESIDVKSTVKRGEPMLKYQGDLDMHELLEINGYDDAVKYLVLKLYDTFSSQDVNMKYFEVIASAMTVEKLLESTNTSSGKKYDAGMTVSHTDIYRLERRVSTKTLVGIKYLPKYKNDFIESMLMENMTSYVPRAIILNNEDSMSNPITKIMFNSEDSHD